MVLLLGVGYSQHAVDAEITGFDACTNVPALFSPLGSLADIYPVPTLSGPVLVRIKTVGVFKCFDKCKALIQMPIPPPHRGPAIANPSFKR